MGQTGGMGVPPKGNGRENSVVQELKMHNYRNMISSRSEKPP